MANILEFLRGVLTDAESQRLFRSDPEGFVTEPASATSPARTSSRPSPCCGGRSLPDVADALADFEDESQPPARSGPAFSERELDAAMRQLRHAVDPRRRLGPHLLPSAFPEPVLERPGTHRESRPKPSPCSSSPARRARARVGTRTRTGGRATTSPSRSTRARAVDARRSSSTAAPTGGPVDISGMPSVDAFTTAISQRRRRVRSLLDEYAEDVRRAAAAAVLAQAERDAADTRAVRPASRRPCGARPSRRRRRRGPTADDDRDTARQVLARRPRRGRPHRRRRRAGPDRPRGPPHRAARRRAGAEGAHRRSRQRLPDRPQGRLIGSARLGEADEHEYHEQHGREGHEGDERDPEQPR